MSLYRPVSFASHSLASRAAIDIGTNRLSVAANGIDEVAVRAALIAGRNVGGWDGMSGISSTAAGTGSGRAVGYKVNEGLLEIAWAALGDTNLDGKVDAIDLVGISSSNTFGNGRTAEWSQGDFNYDGVVNALDLVAMQSTGLYGKGSYLPQAETGNSLRVDPMLIFAALAHQADDE